MSSLSPSTNAAPVQIAEKDTFRQPSFWKTLLFYVSLALLFRIAIFEAFEIEGPSMEPTLLNGDRVVVSKFSYGLFLPFMKQALVTWGQPEASEVVIVKSPADNIDIVKRIIGLPGDVIEIRDDIVYRNGRALGSGKPRRCGDLKAEHRDLGCTWVAERLDQARYFTSQSLSSPVANYPSVRVPKDHVYILGDHRDRSNDSRFFGPVPINRIKGRGLVIYWSKDHNVRWNRMFRRVQ